jgi:hypothetical protein
MYGSLNYGVVNYYFLIYLNLNLKYIIALTLSNTSWSADLYFILKILSFTFNKHLAYEDARL